MLSRQMEKNCEQRPKILVADRNPNIRSFLKRELSSEGYEVIPVADGRELVEAISREDCPSLLVIDIDLPLMEGTEILAVISNRVPSLSVIIHTNLSELRDDPLCRNALSFIEKGDDIRDLKAAIRKVFATEHQPSRYTGSLTALRRNAGD